MGKPQKPHRPINVTILAAIVLIVAMVNLIRFISVIQLWEFLNELLPFSPFYLAVGGFFWGLAGLILAYGIFQGLGWARLYFWVFGLTYTLYFWLDRLLMPGHLGRNVNWPFLVGLNLLFFGCSLWFLSRPTTRAFFGVMHEQR
jgi:hypothetical protein